MRPARSAGPARFTVALALALLPGLGGCHGSGGRARGHRDLLVSAAMSLHDVLPKVARAFEAGHPGTRVSLNFAGSGTLARQIEAGAPVDLFVSADLATVDGLGPRVVARRQVLTTGLVVVVPAGAKAPPRGAAELAKLSRLALGNDTVPAGRYARAWLKRAGVWDAVKGRVVPGDNVRAVLAAVASGAVPAGIVYATDAKVEPRVTVAFPVPAAQAPQVTYEAAVIRGARHPGAARRLMAFLTGKAARAAFTAAGFTVLGAPAGGHATAGGRATGAGP